MDRPIDLHRQWMSATSATTTSSSTSAPVLGVGVVATTDAPRDKCRDTKADCEHGNLSTRPDVYYNVRRLLVRP